MSSPDPNWRQGVVDCIWPKDTKAHYLSTSHPFPRQFGFTGYTTDSQKFFLFNFNEICAFFFQSEKSWSPQKPYSHSKYTKF